MVVTSPTEEAPGLSWSEPNHPDQALVSLHTLQKSGQFCDVTLIVENHAIPVHRAVLAVTSPYLFQLFNMAEDEDKSQRHFKLRDMDYTSFVHILNFAYSASLDVPSAEVKGVYKAALRLEVNQVSAACSKFLADHLTPRDCLATRMFAVDEVLKEKSNQYIAEHMSEVMSEYHIKGLPHIKVEVIGAATTQLSCSDSEGQLFRLVICWLKNQFSNIPYCQIDDLVNRVHILYLNTDNSLTDCNELDEKSDLNNCDIVKDYKTISKKQLNTNLRSSRESLNLLLDQGTMGENGSAGRSRRASPQTVGCNEWGVVATQSTDDNACVGLAILNGAMSTVSLHLSPPPTSNQSEAGSDVAGDTGLLDPDRLASLELLAVMSTARCAAGVAALNGKVIVCGGYDRGECLETVEAYDFDTNEWTALPDMMTKRGRIDIAEMNGQLYACGGSDGTKDLKSVERYDPDTNKWSFISDIDTPLCHPSMLSLCGHLYVVGGSNGINSTDVCQVYDTKRDVWSPVAKLNIGRSQSAICQYAGTLFVVGGTDSWSCITPSVEMYDIDTDSWTLVASLNTARRGAAAVTCNDKLYIIGGTDGVQTLSSTEIYDPERNIWVYGPTLSSPRANIGAVAIDGHIFVAGGFNGKFFLDTIEYLDGETNEWCAYMPPKELPIEGNSNVNNLDTVENADMNGFDENGDTGINGSENANANGYDINMDTGMNGLEKNGDVTMNGLGGNLTIKMNGLKENVKPGLYNGNTREIGRYNGGSDRENGDFGDNQKMICNSKDGVYKSKGVVCKNKDIVCKSDDTEDYVKDVCARLELDNGSESELSEIENASKTRYEGSDEEGSELKFGDSFKLEKFGETGEYVGMYTRTSQGVNLEARTVDDDGQ